MEMSFWTKTSLLPRVQQFVRRTDGRFKGNPIDIGERALTVLTFTDCNNANRFSLLLRIAEQPYF
jgi:hypothetical protein